MKFNYAEHYVKHMAEYGPGWKPRDDKFDELKVKIDESIQWRRSQESLPWYAPAPAVYLDAPVPQLIIAPPVEPCWGCYTGEHKAAHSCKGAL